MSFFTKIFSKKDSNTESNIAESTLDTSKIDSKNLDSKNESISQENNLTLQEIPLDTTNTESNLQETILQDSTLQETPIHTSELESITSNVDKTEASFINESKNVSQENIKEILQNLHGKDSKKAKKIKADSKTKQFFLNKINHATEFLETLFLKEPLVYSLAYENNIACKFNDKMLTTKDGNLCAGVKIQGISYAGATMNKEIELATSRNQFWNRLSSDLELNIFCKKELIDLNLKEEKINNIYAEEIIKKWEKGIKAYKITYTLIFSTKKKRIAGYFESKKRKMTEEQEENKDNLSFENKEAKLKEILQLTTQDLSDYNPVVMTSDEILNFFATYTNMQNVNLKYSNDLITDCYITSDVEFKKDYMIFYTNMADADNDSEDSRKKVYARFISVKAYETEMVSTLIPTGIIRESSDYYYMLHCEAISREQALKKVKRVRTFAVDIVKSQLEELVQLLQSERENIIKISLSILIVSHNDVADLNEKTDSMKSLLEKQNLSIVRETLNQKALYFSFFPSRGNLNARMRHQTGAVLSTLCQFENDIIGNTSNRWGNRPITTFQHLSGSPFLFNLHDSDSSSAVGHTLVIGGTGFGKTTIMQFIMLNLFKYDINIFAMDKLRGMHNFTEYLGCEYHDLGYEKFKLNPFSLEDTAENNEFLKQWLADMMNITTGRNANEAEMETINIIQETIKSLRASHKHLGNEISLKDFYDSIRLPNEKINLKTRIESYLGGLFDNKEDALNFNKQLSILNMDSILNNQELAGLSAMYLFHKIKNISKNADKGFFIWIDELRDYLGVESMRNKIIEAIVEIRKINGVITMGIQNLDFLDGVANSNTFIDNMSNFIIFPTNDETTLDKLHNRLGLSETEINFLRTARKSARQILFKQKEVGSCILDVNLGKLGDYLRVFSSSANDVNQLNALKLEYHKNWRQMYLRNIKPKDNLIVKFEKEQQEQIELIKKKDEIEKQKERQKILNEAKELEAKEKNKTNAEIAQDEIILQDLKDSNDFANKNTESSKDSKHNEKLEAFKEKYYKNLESKQNISQNMQPSIVDNITNIESNINEDEVLYNDSLETNIILDSLNDLESKPILPQQDSNNILLNEIRSLKAEIESLKSKKDSTNIESNSYSSNIDSNIIDFDTIINTQNLNTEEIIISPNMNFETKDNEDQTLNTIKISETKTIENDEFNQSHLNFKNDSNEVIESDNLEIKEAKQIESTYTDIKTYSNENIEDNIDNLDIQDSNVWNLEAIEDANKEDTTPPQDAEDSAKDIWADSESNVDSADSNNESSENIESSGDSSKTQESLESNVDSNVESSVVESSTESNTENIEIQNKQDSNNSNIANNTAENIEIIETTQNTESKSKDSKEFDFDNEESSFISKDSIEDSKESNLSQERN